MDKKLIQKETCWRLRCVSSKCLSHVTVFWGFFSMLGSPPIPTHPAQLKCLSCIYYKPLKALREFTHKTWYVCTNCTVLYSKLHVFISSTKFYIYSRDAMDCAKIMFFFCFQPKKKYIYIIIIREKDVWPSTTSSPFISLAYRAPNWLHHCCWRYCSMGARGTLWIIEQLISPRNLSKDI